MTATRTRSYRRRGTAYAFFLMTTLLVTIIGMAGLRVAGIGLRSAVAINQQVEAQACAQSGVELGLVALNRTNNWRDNLPVDTWSTPVAVGNGLASWKIKPVVGTTFTGKRNGSVRVYGRGTAGDATWLYSVEVQPPAEVLLDNELTNGDLESGTATPWFAYGSCAVQYADWNVYEGGGSLHVAGRAPGSGAGQLVQGLVSGGTVRAQAYVSVNGTPQPVWMRLEVQSTAGTQQFEIATAASVAKWRALGGTITPTWDGTLTSAALLIGSDDTEELLIDAARFMLMPAPPGPIDGTWQREPD